MSESVKMDSKQRASLKVKRLVDVTDLTFPIRRLSISPWISVCFLSDIRQTEATGLRKVYRWVNITKIRTPNRSCHDEDAKSSSPDFSHETWLTSIDIKELFCFFGFFFFCIELGDLERFVGLHWFVDEELPEYVMVMVGNKRSLAQMAAELKVFLGNGTVDFTDW